MITLDEHWKLMNEGTKNTLFLLNLNITADCNFHICQVKNSNTDNSKQLQVQGIATVIITNLLLRVNTLVASCVDLIHNLSKTSQKSNKTTQ